MPHINQNLNQSDIVNDGGNKNKHLLYNVTDVKNQWFFYVKTTFSVNIIYNGDILPLFCSLYQNTTCIFRYDLIDINLKFHNVAEIYWWSKLWINQHTHSRWMICCMTIIYHTNKNMGQYSSNSIFTGERSEQEEIY